LNFKQRKGANAPFFYLKSYTMRIRSS